jgi:hypothetical protein
MAEIAPPPYVGANVTVNVGIKVTSTETSKVQQLSPEAKAAATAILEDPSNKQLIKDSINTLCTQTLGVRKAFEDISDLLGTFDARKFKTKENNYIEALRPVWDSLRYVRHPRTTSQLIVSFIFSDIHHPSRQVAVRCSCYQGDLPWCVDFLLLLLVVQEWC